MNLNQHLGVLTIRIILGLVFLMQGIGKVLKIGVDNVYQGFFYETYKDLLPELLLKFTAYYTSYIELIGGFLLIAGLFRNYVLYALASVLISADQLLAGKRKGIGFRK
ncbi:MAG: DoxX family protein [Cyclobacteriaceae bacterium]